MKSVGFGVRETLMSKHQAVKFFLTSLVITGALTAISSCGLAEDIGLGKSNYDSSCAVCHGQDGKGNGPLSPELRTRPPDLTLIAKNNGGVFPTEVLRQIIDGRRTIRAHGTYEMPVWGLAFQSGPEDVIRSRLLAIIDYLRTIQLK
jgi:mono/diheme cytochrome c family protein